MLTLGLLHLYILNKSEIYFLSMPFENKRYDNQKYDRFNKRSAQNNLVLEKHLELALLALRTTQVRLSPYKSHPPLFTSVKAL